MNTRDTLAIISLVLGIVTSLVSLVEDLQEQYAQGVPSVWLITVAVALGLTAVVLQWRRPAGLWLRGVVTSFHDAIDRWRPTLILLILVISLALLFWSASLASNSSEIARLSAAEYIGNFPDNMERITELAGRAKHRLIVVTDLAAYGAFSAPEEHAKYKIKLEEMKTNDVELSVLIYSDEVARGAVRDQFNLETEGSEEKLREFLDSDMMTRYITANLVERPSNREEFVEMVIDKNSSLRQVEPFKNVTECFAERFPVFLWIRDNNEAVFSFYNLGQQSREVSFYTNKPSLVRILVEIYESMKTAGTVRCAGDSTTISGHP